MSIPPRLADTSSTDAGTISLPCPQTCSCNATAARQPERQRHAPALVEECTVVDGGRQGRAEMRQQAVHHGDVMHHRRQKSPGERLSPRFAQRAAGRFLQLGGRCGARRGTHALERAVGFGRRLPAVQADHIELAVARMELGFTRASLELDARNFDRRRLAHFANLLFEYGMQRAPPP